MTRSGRRLFICLAAFVLMLPAPLQAQRRDRFVEGLVNFSDAVIGSRGDEGPLVLQALDQMASGLAEWDDVIGKVESQFASEIGRAAPPAAARMRAALGTVYLERGRLQDALEQFDTAATLDPEFADVHRLRGLTYEVLGRPGDAASAYFASWEKDARGPATAYLLLRGGGGPAVEASHPAAMRTLTDAVEAAGTPGAPLFGSAALLDDASLAAPVFLPARYTQGVGLIKAKQYDAAIVALRTAAGADPLVRDGVLQDAAVQEAIRTWRKANHPDAGNLLREAASRTGSAELHRILGLLYAGAGQHAEALTHHRRSVELDPRNERARLALADALVASGDPEGARQVLADAVRTLPMSGHAHWKLAQLHARLGDQAAALRAYEAAADLPALAGAVHVNAAVGHLYHNRVELEAAARAYERRMALTPNDAAAHYDLGEIYRAQGRNDAALTEYLVSALLDPSKARTFATIGQVYAASGRDNEAVAMLRRALALDTAQLEARYALSRALLRLGRRDEAERELAIFGQLQAEAMREERRRFQENQNAIQEVLERTTAQEVGR